MAPRIRRRLARADARQRRHHPDQHRPRRHDRRRAGGKWYGGVYGWGFTVHAPSHGQSSSTATSTTSALIGFGNAYLLTGDDRYLDVWRKQIDGVNAQGKSIDGRTLYPHMYGDEGWYDFTPAKYADGADEFWYWSMREDDRQTRPRDPAGSTYLEGQAPGYPEQALRADFAAFRPRVEDMRRDTTTPDTRLADDPMAQPGDRGGTDPTDLGGIYPGHPGDRCIAASATSTPRRRAGLPPDVAALVEGLTAGSTTLTLVNVNQTEPRQ